MHIISITISGFKSYRDATTAGPFSPSHNVVVGRNGAGKSNFFDAVRFVLSDTFAHLRAEERVALLHEGAGASVLSAYVEIVFDNSDGRLPFERDSVALRRMVGLQKDEYVLDRKNVSRTEVFNLFESAGFSRSNPYYIVQQGKVAALCAMSDKSRLELLQEVAGTHVYDSRREESLKLMDDTDSKLEKITEVITVIESRLQELDSEKEELAQFLELDRSRRAIEYTVYVKELDTATAALEEISNARAASTSASADASARIAAAHARSSAAERAVEVTREELKAAATGRAPLASARKDATDAVARLNVRHAEASRSAASAAEALAVAQRELSQVSALANARREELGPLETDFIQARDDERECRREVAEIDSSVVSLRAKSDRGNHFRTVRERDVYLDKEIKDARRAAESARKQLLKARADVVRLDGACANNHGRMSGHQTEISQLEGRVSQLDVELGVLHKKRDAVHMQRHEKWRQDSELDGKLSALIGDVKRLQSSKRFAFGASTFHSIKTVMDAAMADHRRLGPSRVFGPLVDLIHIDDKFTTAADVTAGNSLTHVVVDNDATAAILVRILQDRRAGRVTFIPLSRLNPNPRPPPQATSDALALVSKIQCDERFMPAVHQVFGRTMVTRTVDVAGRFSREHGVDCVTLDGDQVNRQGAMTGGFIDLSKSKIQAARDLRRGEDEVARLQPLAASAKNESGQNEAELSKVLGEIQQQQAVHRSSTAKIMRLRSEIDQFTRYVRVDTDNIAKGKERIMSLEETVAASEKRQADFEAERSTPMTSGLTDEEAQRLDILVAELETKKDLVKELGNRRSELERSVSSIKSELEGNLDLRLAELQRTIESGAQVGDDTGDVDAVNETPSKILEKVANDLASSKAELASAEDALRVLDGNIVELEKSVSVQSREFDSAKEAELRLNAELEEEKSRADSMFSKRAVHVQKKADSERKIRELGSLPADFDKYRSASVGSLLRKLKHTNESLKSYSHVNKKALDQYVTFTEQRELLRKRREELETGASDIRKLIEVLDHRKDSDILRTFKGVSKYFSEVFSELVPGGRAALVMQKASSDNNAKDAARQPRMQYNGVAMKVAFTTTGEAYLLQQLSGGQKSIVALALIFAIQRLDPAPFYLFDEIDANLDASHRQAVADVILKQSDGKAQFVTTTFRPEFVNAGDKWFGVTHRNKVSSVQEVTQEVALTFINKDEVAQ